MKKDEGILARPEKVKTPIEELEVLAELEGTQYFVVLKRVARRYTEALKTQSFLLNPTDPNFKIKHTQHAEQAVGMNLLIKLVESARKQLREDDEDNTVIR